MLPQPPDPTELRDAFPLRTVQASFPFARIHDEVLEPEWFCSDGECRFDPPVDPVFGACYVAGNPLGAFVERFGRLRAVPRRLVEAKVLSYLYLPSDTIVCISPRTRSSPTRRTGTSSVVMGSRRSCGLGTTTEVRNRGPQHSILPLCRHLVPMPTRHDGYAARPRHLRQARRPAGSGPRRSLGTAIESTLGRGGHPVRDRGG